MDQELNADDTLEVHFAVFSEMSSSVRKNCRNTWFLHSRMCRKQEFNLIDFGCLVL